MVWFSVELFDLYLLLFRYGVNGFYITIHHNDCTLLVLHFSFVTCPASNCASTVVGSPQNVQQLVQDLMEPKPIVK